MTQEAAEQQIGVKEAIARARASLKDVFQDRQLDRLLLEEVELSDDESKWIITFGFDESVPPTRHTPMSFGVPFGEFVRVYKIVTVDAATGEVRSIKIRNV